MAAASIVSGLFSLVSAFGAKDDAKSAARDQEKLARENAMNIESEGREEERRAVTAQDKVSAEQRARAAASGTRSAAGDSQSLFMDEEASQFGKDIDWLRQSTKNKSKYEKLSGKYAADATKRKGDSAFWGGIGGAGKSFASGFSQANASGGWFS